MDTKEEQKQGEQPEESPTKADDAGSVEIAEEPIEVDLTEDLYCGDYHEDIV